MAYVVVFDRFVWLDRCIRGGGYPNATTLAERFEIARKTAQRNIDFMSDRLGDRLGRKLTVLCNERSVSEDRRPACFSASWHGHSPVDETLFRTTAQALVENRMMTIAYR